jgi:hypothetical protein
MRYTKSDIKNLGICPDYTDERLDELLAGRESMSARELSELDIPLDDLLWLLGRLCADDRNTVARRIARDVLPFWEGLVPEIVTQYLETGDPELRDTAWAAASDAEPAARAARWAARWAAAESAAIGAAIDAAMAVAWAVGPGSGFGAKQKYLGWMVEFCESREEKE